jgi:quinol monooxygenase YgiN
MKIYLTAIIKAKPEFKTEVLALLNNMVIETRREEACELYQLHQSNDDENTFVFYEIWENQSGLDFHNQQPYLQEFVSLTDEKLQEKPIIYKTKLL